MKVKYLDRDVPMAEAADACTVVLDWLADYAAGGFRGEGMTQERAAIFLGVAAPLIYPGLRLLQAQVEEVRAYVNPKA